MNNAPIIDLSMCAPEKMIAERGMVRGVIWVAWLRVIRPTVVGAIWALICIYTYRYLLPVNTNEMPIEQLVFYMSCISVMAAAIATWLITARVLHPMVYRVHASKRLHHTTSLVSRSAAPGALAQSRRPLERPASQILVASHDDKGSIAAIQWASGAAVLRAPE